MKPVAGRKRSPKLVLRRSHPLTLAAVLAALILSTMALLYLHFQLETAQKEYNALRLQAAQLENSNQQLSQRIESLGSVESAILIAMEKLGLVDPDSVIIDPDN